MQPRRGPHWLVLDIFVSVMLVILFEVVHLPDGILRQLGLLALIVFTFGGMAVWVVMNAAPLEQEPLDETEETEGVPHKPRWTARTVRTRDALK